ncbi:MAG: 3-isopropylmalate dehydrogenase [Candidatus Tectomicrobia bacterium]|nr:3-isopropylmalate dehydrogenase [Candidatus Tectomicrobia bacterium]
MAEVLKITLLPGDGIGREVMEGARTVLGTVAKKFRLALETREALIGGAAIDATGHPLPPETLALCKSSDAILLGAVGGPKWDSLPPEKRPERGALLPLRKELGLFANLRPARLYDALVASSSLRAAVVQGLDLLVLRELTGGIYFGEPQGVRKDGKGKIGVNTMVYTTAEIERIARLGFELARKRRKKLTSVDKFNVLAVSRLWREVVNDVARDYPDVQLEHMLVDNCAMQLVRWPRQFDVIVTSNLFGDILSDEAAMLTGSIGMLPSASLGDPAKGGPAGKGPLGLFEPVHGTAPEIAGKDVANPIATILSVAMMLDYGLGEPGAARAIGDAVSQVLDSGARTADIASEGDEVLGTKAMSARIAEAVERM